MKKVLAIILSIAMLFGVLTINTFAEGTTDPTVTLVTNAGSPVEEGVTTYLTVNFKNFSTIKGMDVTISAEGAVLGAVNVTGFKGLVENENFTKVNTENKHEIHIVDLTAGAETGKITFQVTAPAKTAKITVTGKYADSGKTLFTIADSIGNLEVKKDVVAEVIKPAEGETITEEKPVIIEQPKAEEGSEKPAKFIPYGSVYKVDEETGEISYAEKDKNGNFTITEEGYQVNSFDVPANGITTFGVSENTTDSSVLRFGNYSKINKDADFNGTMVFEGEWLVLKNYYIKHGYTVQQLLNMIYENFDDTIKNSGKKYVYYNVPTDKGNVRINVYKFRQQNYMWKDEDNGILEYAIRLNNAKDDTTYTAVAYSETADGVATISENVKSEKKLAKAN